MHRNDSSSIAWHIKTHFIPKYKIWKILVENTTIISHEFDKLQQQIQETLHKKTKKKPTINRINSENRNIVLKCL